MITTTNDDSNVIEIAGAESLYIELANGARAHYMAAGPVTGSPVVLLHGGLPGSSGAAGWRFMMPALAEAGFRVYAPDRPGFGLSDTRPEYRPIRGHMSWVQFVKDFVDALGLERFQIAGNSQGAQCAAYFTVTYPELVERLGMIATSGFNDAFDIPKEKLTRGTGFPAWEGTKESMKDMMTAIIHRGEAVTDEVLDMRTQSAEMQRNSFMAAAKWNRNAAKDPNTKQLLRLKGRLDRLTIPMIYLYGRQDVLGPVENAYLQEDQMPNVQVFYPDDCGHQGQTDQPEMFNQVFTEFFSTGTVSRAAAEWAGVSTRRPVLASIVTD
ncbi:MAG: alpha/beta hydrolase [Arthrobacter sp.]